MMPISRDTMFASCLALASALTMATPAAAQTASADAAACLPDASGRVPAGCPAVVAESEDIVVTGTRIQLPNMEANEPTITTTREFIEDRNLTNIGAALSELPVFRGGTSPNRGQGRFGGGVSFANYFGLGSNRTLTLVNNRRFVTSNVSSSESASSPGVQVDLNVIPSILVERIDTFAIGGATVYGSDAIAGGVNLILRDRFEGIEATGLTGITEDGDGMRYNASVLLGRNFAGGRGNITLALSRDVQNGVLLNDRAIGRAGQNNAFNPSTAQALALGRPAAGITPANDGRLNPTLGYNDSTSDGIPGIIAAREIGVYFLNRNGVLTQATGNPGAVLNFQFSPSGALVPYNRGITFPGIQTSGGDAFRYTDYEQIASQVDRNTAYAFANFEVSNALRFFAEGTYYNAFTEELTQQPEFNSSLFGNTVDGALTFSATNPMLTQQARDRLRELGITSFQLSRVQDDLSSTGGSNRTDLKRFVVGAAGDFSVGGRAFNYEVSANYGHNLIRDTFPELITQNYINAVNVTRNAAGQLVCDPNPAIQAAPGGRAIADPNCVPLDVFGLNRASPAARAYVMRNGVTRSRLSQFVVNANVGGSPFTLFGNDQGFNVGVEHRRENAVFTPSDILRQGISRDPALQEIAGGFNVTEAFGEARFVLVTPDNDLSFLSNLELFASARYVDNSVSGGFLAWSAGGRIAPIPDITVVGNYTKSFRAPAIIELFLPVTRGRAAVPDLCAPAFIGAGAAPDIRRRNCAAFLQVFPNATPLEAQVATVPSLSGGNPELDNEVARSFTVGLLLRPRWVPGLSIRADYLDIRIAQPISNLDVGTITSACFDNPNFNASDPANGNAFCSNIQRYPTTDTGLAANGGSRAGQVVVDPLNPGVSSGFVNGNRIFFSGIQGTVDYQTSLDGIGVPGTFGVGNLFLINRRRLSDITGVAPFRTDGTIGDPKFTLQTNLRYANDIWGVFTSVNYVGRQIASRVANSRDLREFNRLSPYATINASVFMNVTDQFRFSFEVTNLANRVGQRYFDSIIFPNDFMGRRFTVSGRVRF